MPGGWDGQGWLQHGRLYLRITAAASGLLNRSLETFTTSESLLLQGVLWLNICLLWSKVYDGYETLMISHSIVPNNDEYYRANVPGMINNNRILPIQIHVHVQVQL